MAARRHCRVWGSILNPTDALRTSVGGVRRPQEEQHLLVCTLLLPGDGNTGSLFSQRGPTMTTTDERTLVRALMRRHGKTLCAELGIPIEANTPAPLFQLLCVSILYSARIGAQASAQAARALFHEGWTTPRKMAASTWERRAQVLNQSGYARYDNRTASMLGDSAAMVLERYKGDLRNLREQAEHDPARERHLLKQFKGIGDTGADIFLREVQVVWREAGPFLDKKARKGAQSLGLPDDPQRLAQLSGRGKVASVATALVRTQLAKDKEEILEAAGRH